LSNNNLTGEIPSQFSNLFLEVCNVWFGNNLICDPSYSIGVTRCMGIQGYYDSQGDAPNCSVTTSPKSRCRGSSHTGNLVSFTVNYHKFHNARAVRVQFRVKNSKKMGIHWACLGVDGFVVNATIPRLLPSTEYEYRFIVRELNKSRLHNTQVATFMTPSF